MQQLTSDDRRELFDALIKRFTEHEISAVEFRRECYKIGVSFSDVDDIINEHSRARGRDNGDEHERAPFQSGLPFDR